MVSPAVCRDDCRENAVGLLLIAVVGEPFFVDRNAVEIVEPGFDIDLGITCPAIFLTLRAIGGIAEKVG